MRKFKVAMISEHGDPFAKIGGEQAGGQNLYVKYLGQKLVERGYQVDVFTRWQSKKMPKISVKKGLRVIRIKAGEIAFLHRDEFTDILPEFTDNIIKFMKKEGKYDIVHSHYWLSGLVAADIKKKIGIPFVHTFHSLGAVKHRTMGIDNEKSRYREEQEKKIVHESNAIISTSPNEVDDIRKYCFKQATNIVVVPVGVDLKKFCFYSKSLAKKELKTRDKHIILFVGRLEERKGIKVLIKAVSLLIKTLPKEHLKFKLWIIGGDAEKAGTGAETEEIKEILKIIEKTNTKKHIKFVGRVPNFKLKKYYAAADVTVVPSYYEPFGIVPIESMACGTPVIASRIGGLQFTVEDGITGYLVPPKDYRTIAKRIRGIFTDVDLRMKLTSNSIENINKHFSWDDVTTMIGAVYNSITSKKHLKKNTDLEPVLV
jgi:glycosyltransferase involved in cell wall biosynthesis